jgi:hypothetical protein
MFESVAATLTTELQHHNVSASIIKRIVYNLEQQDIDDIDLRLPLLLRKFGLDEDTISVVTDAVSIEISRIPTMPEDFDELDPVGPDDMDKDEMYNS